MLPPGMPQKGMAKPSVLTAGTAVALLVRNGAGGLWVSSPHLYQNQKTKKSEAELLLGTPQGSFPAQGQPHDPLQSSRPEDETQEVLSSAV